MATPSSRLRNAAAAYSAGWSRKSTASGAAPTVAKPGIYLGLIAAVAIAYGGYLSMRAESSPFGDPASVETVRTAWTGAGSMARTGAGSASRAEADSAPRTESSSAGRTGRDV